MSSIEVKHGQSLFDIAVQELGNASYAMDVALLNNISVTDALVPGSNIDLPQIEIAGFENKVVKYFRETKTQKPATAL